MTCSSCGYTGPMEQTTWQPRTHRQPESVTYCPECGEVSHTDPV